MKEEFKSSSSSTKVKELFPQPTDLPLCAIPYCVLQQSSLPIKRAADDKNYTKQEDLGDKLCSSAAPSARLSR